MTVTERTTTAPGVARLVGIDLARGLAVFGAAQCHGQCGGQQVDDFHGRSAAPRPPGGRDAGILQYVVIAAVAIAVALFVAVRVRDRKRSKAS